MEPLKKTVYSSLKIAGGALLAAAIVIGGKYAANRIGDHYLDKASAQFEAGWEKPERKSDELNQILSDCYGWKEYIASKKAKDRFYRCKNTLNQIVMMESLKAATRTSTLLFRNPEPKRLSLPDGTVIEEER